MSSSQPHSTPPGGGAASTLSLFPEPRACTTCGATTTGHDQTTVPTCAYDLQRHLEPWQRDHVNRPRTCLHTHQPTTAQLPDTF
jgi:hypothetical protein